MNFFLCIFSIFFFSTAFAFESQKTDTGHALFSEQQNTPYQYILVVFPFGAAEIPAEKQGTLSLLGDVLNVGPSDKTEQEFLRFKFMNNVSIDFEFNEINFIATIKVQSGSLEKATELFKDILKKPNLDMKTFKERKRALISNATNLIDNPRAITFYYSNKIMRMGDRSFLDGQSTPLTLKNIQPDDLKKALKNINLSEAQLYSFGPMPSKTVKKALAKILPKHREKRKRKFQIAKKVPVEKSYLLQKEGATDNQLLMMKRINIKPYSEDFAKAKIAMSILGGGMSSRLMQTLRVKGGLTYGANSDIQEVNKDQSLWSIRTFGGIKQFPKLLKKTSETILEFSNKGVSNSEINEVKKTLITEHKKNYELPYDLFSTKMWLHLRGFPTSYPENFEKFISTVDEKSLSLFIKNNFNIENMVLFSHGDRNHVLKHLPEKKVIIDIETIR